MASLFWTNHSALNSASFIPSRRPEWPRVGWKILSESFWSVQKMDRFHSLGIMWQSRGKNSDAFHEFGECNRSQLEYRYHLSSNQTTRDNSDPPVIILFCQISSECFVHHRSDIVGSGSNNLSECCLHKISLSYHKSYSYVISEP